MLISEIFVLFLFLLVACWWVLTAREPVWFSPTVPLILLPSSLKHLKSACDDKKLSTWEQCPFGPSRSATKACTTFFFNRKSRALSFPAHKVVCYAYPVVEARTHAFLLCGRIVCILSGWFFFERRRTYDVWWALVTLPSAFLVSLVVLLLQGHIFSINSCKKNMFLPCHLLPVDYAVSGVRYAQQDNLECVLQIHCHQSHQNLCLKKLTNLMVKQQFQYFQCLIFHHRGQLRRPIVLHSSQCSCSYKHFFCREVNFFFEKTNLSRKVLSVVIERQNTYLHTLFGSVRMVLWKNNNNW